MEINSTLAEELKKNYQVIEKVHSEWKITQTNSYVFLDSLLNLSEQLRCCEDSTFDLELRNDFPDLKKKLTYKITKAMEGKMKRLYELLKTFETLKDDIANMKKSTFQVYQDIAGTFDIEYLTQGSPTCPPLACLLEWLVDITWSYNTLYEQKKDLLDYICYHDNTYLQSLPQKWKDETCLYRVKDIMDQVSMFLH